MRSALALERLHLLCEVGDQFVRHLERAEQLPSRRATRSMYSAHRLPCLLSFFDNLGRQCAGTFTHMSHVRIVAPIRGGA